MSTQTVAKGEFAKICGVSPGRVTQWIDEGKISGDALVGEGRAAKINVEIAKAQIALRRDVGQALGNGLATRLADPKPPSPPKLHEDPDAPDSWAGDDNVDRQLKLAKLESSQRANRLEALEEAAKNGIYTETAAARAEMGKIAGQMIRIFEGALPALATALAAEFKLPARDVTHQLNEQFRKIREQAAEAAAKLAADLPETVVAA